MSKTHSVESVESFFTIRDSDKFPIPSTHLNPPPSIPSNHSNNLKTKSVFMKHLMRSAIMLAVLFTSSLTFAQQQMSRKTPEEKAQNNTQWMQKNLALTDDQNKKAYDIILRYARQADDARNSASGQEKRQEMQGIESAKDNELRAVLTGDQFQKYQAHMQEMKQKMQERRSTNPQ
jgi:hypothetical protein